jgi:uncharacterized membrane protein YhaH (DUF805 family)
VDQQLRVLIGVGTPRRSTGRIGRAHYWVLLFSGCVLVFLAATLGSLNLDNRPIQWVAYAILLASCIPITSAAIRRLHDLNLSGWHIFAFMTVTGLLQIFAFILATYSTTLGIILGALTVGAFVLLGILRSTAGENRYGL